MYFKTFTRLFLLLGMLGLFSAPLRADEITIGSGTDKSLYLPSYSYYNYSLSQQIYTADELGGASGSISSLAFYNDGTTQTRNFDIYMVNTNKASFTSNIDWITVTTTDRVFNGNVTLTAGTWTTIALTTPFEYSGSNIAIMVDDNTGSCSSSNQHVQCRVFSSTGSQSLYAYRDGADYDPLSLPPTGSGTIYIKTFKNQIKLEIATAPITCAKPTDLAATDLTAHTAVLDWTKGSDDQETWEIYLTQTATDIPDEESVATYSENVTKPFALNNLASSSNYYAYVRANCGDTDGKSKWSAGCHFATTCEAVETFPFTEGFDDLTTNGEIPMCWNNEEGTTTNENYKWSYNSSYGTGHSGKCVRFDSYSNGNGLTNFLKTPVMSLPQSQAMQLRFWYKNPKGGDFSVFISTDGGQTHETALATGLTNATEWTEKTIDLSDYKGETNVVIVFKGTSNYGSNDARIYLDDVNIELAPTCPKQNALHVTALTSSSATLDWTAGNSEQDHWDLYLTTEAGFTPDNNTLPTVINTNQKPYIFTDLNNETVYFAFVRARCSDTDESDWTDACRFVTPQIPVAVDGEHPYENDFESTCNWLFVNGDRPNQWCYGSAANNTPNGEKAIYISNDGGTNNSYTNTKSVVYATKAFAFAEGVYTFTYDWRAKGNQYYDYIRVALVPASFEIVASENPPTSFDFQLPTGWIALDGGSKLNNSDVWSTVIADGIAVAAGEYKMVVAWRNLTYSINQPPAAIDNISISLLTCPKPTLSYVSYSATAYSSTVQWTGSSATDFEIAYKPSSDFDPSDYTLENVTRVQLQNVSEYIYTLENLTPETKYYIYVQADCGSEDGKSSWSNRTIFTTSATCVAPSSLTKDATTSSTVTLHWTKGAEDQDTWQFRYKKTTDTEYTYLLVENLSTPQYTLNELEAATSYHINVRAWCSDTDQSKWCFADQTYDLTVTTECGALVLPYTYGFEDNLVTTSPYSSSNPFPNCWSRIAYQSGYSGSYTYYPYVFTATYSQPWAHGGNGANSTSGHCLYFYQTSSSTNECAVLPEISSEYEMNQLQVRFWAAVRSSQGTLNIGIMESPTDASTFISIQEVNVSNTYSNGFMEFTVPFSTYTGNGRYIALMCGTGSTYAYFLIDDITVEEVPSCPIPTDLEAIVNSATQTTLTWTAGSTESSWELEIITDGSIIAQSVLVTGEPTYTLNTTRATAYTVRVRTNCGDGDYSDWSAPIRFVSDCGFLTVDATHPYFEDFENVGASDFPPICWEKFSHEMSGYTYWYLNSNNGLGSSAAFSYWSQGYAFLVLPQMHIDGEATLSFDYLIGSGTYDESCSVVVSTSELTYADFSQNLWEADATNLPLGKASATVSLEDFNGEDIYIAFKFKGSGTSGCTWYVDNIQVYVPITQTSKLVQGWNWWSPNIEMDGVQLLQVLEQELGSNGVQILSQNSGSLIYEDDEWDGHLQSIVSEQMYMIQVSATCTMTLTGTPVSPAAHPITICNGYNWIGFPWFQSMTLTSAFAGFNPAEGDQIISFNGSAIYEDGEWDGSLTTLQPGKGYIYISHATNNKTLVFGNGGNK